MNYEDLINNVSNIQQLHEIKANLIGKNGEITIKLKELSDKSIDEKKRIGKEINEIKILIEKLIKEKEEQLKKKNSPKIDYSLFNDEKIGKSNLIQDSIKLIEKIFEDIGFSKITGPDIETSYYNFDALNIPVDHPARDNNDTFYINENDVLRTQTTAVQVRLLENLKNMHSNEIRAYSIGRTYRNDDMDATHSCMFHQIEGVILEKNVSMQHLKGFIEYFLGKFFEQDIKITFYPSFFPFTEPSCEIFANMNGKSLELGGCGIIHPDILTKFEVKNEAFAFGMGLERLIMIKHKISNLQELYGNKFI